MPRQIYTVSSLREEFSCLKIGFEDENPQRFAKTEWTFYTSVFYRRKVTPRSLLYVLWWTKSQSAYLTYRIICFVYCASMLIWKCYEASLLPNHSEVDVWFSHYATWAFIIFTIYNCLALLLTALNFTPDLLCNDDFVWYHRVSWFCFTVSFCSAFLVSLATVIGAISRSAGSDLVNEFVKPFKSDEINFFAILAVVMLFEIVVCGIVIRFLHLFHAQLFLVFYFLYHGCRYAAGYGAQYIAVDFGSNKAASTTAIILITTLLIIPLLHCIGFLLSRTKIKIIYGMKKRERRRKFLLNRRSRLLSSSTEAGATERITTGTFSNSNTSSSGYFASSTFLQSRETTPGKTILWTNRVYPRHPPIIEV